MTRICHSKLTKFGLFLLISSILFISKSKCDAQGKLLFPLILSYNPVSHIVNRTRKFQKKRRERETSTQINIRSNFFTKNKLKIIAIGWDGSLKDEQLNFNFYHFKVF